MVPVSVHIVNNGVISIYIGCYGSELRFLTIMFPCLLEAGDFV